MKIFDNVTDIVRDDLIQIIKKGSKVSIAAECFSMYAYNALKKQLENIDELRFIFTSPTFITEAVPKQQREFYIPRLSRESSLYGTEFEIKLRNELTQKDISKECADWIKRKVTFKSNVTNEKMTGFMTVDQSTYMPINGFTTVDLGCERGNNAYYPVQKTESYENTKYFLNLFEQIWNDKKTLQEVTDTVIESISVAYQENSPEFIYFFILYNIFHEFLDDISEDELPNEATGFKQSKIWGMLYDFQKDAVLAIVNKLEKYNGCILADSVGLGKTFTALAVIKYYENRNRSVLVLCPKKLSENWNTFKTNYINNPIAEDRLRYVLRSQRAGEKHTEPQGARHKQGRKGKEAEGEGQHRCGEDGRPHSRLCRKGRRISVRGTSEGNGCRCVQEADGAFLRARDQERADGACRSGGGQGLCKEHGKAADGAAG